MLKPAAHLSERSGGFSQTEQIPTQPEHSAHIRARVSIFENAFLNTVDFFRECLGNYRVVVDDKVEDCVENVILTV